MELLSKQELLARTGISYGQLYRWKWEGLVPEEWFIKQPSFTGQETFFPKDQILRKITAIRDLKGSPSLERSSVLLASGDESAVDLKELSAIPEIRRDFLILFERSFGTKGASIGATAIVYFLLCMSTNLGIQ